MNEYNGARRIKVKAPDDPKWVGKRVLYKNGPDREYGRVVRMATGKTPAAHVLYDGDNNPKYTALSHLEVVND